MPAVRRFCQCLPVLAALAPFAMSHAALGQASTQTITACVGRVTGVARFVAGPGACLSRLETVVQFNAQGSVGPAGPAGPTGPQGPAGPQGDPGPSNNAPFLVRTLIVRAGGTPEENGERLWEAIDAASSQASDSNPYMLQLDAGVYRYSRPTGAGFIVPPGISIRGQSMTSTTITAPGIPLLFRSTEPQSQTSSFSVSDLTVGDYTGYALAAISIQRVLLDHVEARGNVELDATSSGANLLITSSVFRNTLSMNDNNADPTDRFRVVGTQVVSAGGNVPPGVLGCFGSYTYNLIPLNANCQ
ncbi:hypothetical protein [Terriglobus sp.]|uniref:hypothetical protein n=1 Tax=Terriglobus sp. TaxID=1889013 RepID=UPI003B002EAC